MVGIIHHANHSLAVDLDRDRDHISRIPMDQVCGPIQRIKDSADPGTSGDVGPFLAKNRIVRTSGTDGGHQLALRFSVKFRDQVNG